jgi:gas vesicle protein
MSTNWEEVRTSIQEFFSSAAEKTDEFIKVGKRKLSMAEIKRNITGQYAELGGRVYHLVRQGEAGTIESDEEVEMFVSRIHKLEDELKAKEMEIEEIKMGAAAEAEAETVSASEASNRDDGEAVHEDPAKPE